MTRKPRRPVLDPVVPDTPSETELADARRLAARYQTTRVIPLNTPVLGPPDSGRYRREAFPYTAWARAAIRKRQHRVQIERAAAGSIGRMAFALRSVTLTHALTYTAGHARYTRPTTPAA